jgi:hypothetical protein
MEIEEERVEGGSPPADGSVFHPLLTYDSHHLEVFL